MEADLTSEEIERFSKLPVKDQIIAHLDAIMEAVDRPGYTAFWRRKLTRIRIRIIKDLLETSKK